MPLIIESDKLALLDFAKRHFTPDFAGTKITKYESLHNTVDDQANLFMQTLLTNPWFEAQPTDFPFAKMLIVPNFTGCMSGLARITKANKDKLQQGWRVRQPGEPSYYCKWFSSIDVDPEPAEFLHIVVYSRDQLHDEGIDLPAGKDWGIVTINAEQSSIMVPPHPNTLLRNAEGIEAGGNGVQYTDKQMADAKAYHDQWANVL